MHPLPLLLLQATRLAPGASCGLRPAGEGLPPPHANCGTARPERLKDSASLAINQVPEGPVTQTRRSETTSRHSWAVLTKTCHVLSKSSPPTQMPQQLNPAPGVCVVSPAKRIPCQARLLPGFLRAALVPEHPHTQRSPTSLPGALRQPPGSLPPPPQMSRSCAALSRVLLRLLPAQLGCTPSLCQLPPSRRTPSQLWAEHGLAHPADGCLGSDPGWWPRARSSTSVLVGHHVDSSSS